VVRSALTNAASIAALLLTTEALVSEIPEKEKPAPAGGHSHGHGMEDY
jgi:chaperonin GroEL